MENDKTIKQQIDNFLETHGSKAKIRVGYGLTESSSACCLSLPNEMREHCIGIPFPDMEFKIVKVGTHDEVKPNTDGEICVSGPTVMLGYLNEPKETMQTLRHHDDGKLWLHTGDIGHMDEEGMIFFEQRLKRIIISSGYNIYPSQIESVLDKHPAVNFSTVIGITHPYKVQVAKAFIVLNEGYKPNNETLKSIKAHCAKNISKYALPYEYEFRDSLPKTTIGKVAYKKLMFDFYPKLRTGEFVGELVSINKHDQTETYDLKLPTDSLFVKVYGKVKLLYTVYKEQNTVMLTGLEPKGILMDGHKSELTAYKGVMISKTNPEKDMFKINLLNMLEK